MIKLLIVEDEPIERKELVQQISSFMGNSNVFEASSCKEAKEIISREIPDVILLDIMLKGTSGFEVAEFVKENFSGIEIIIVTAYNEFDFAHKALKLGITEYLLKPVRPQTLKDKICELIGKKRNKSGLVAWSYLENGLANVLKDSLSVDPNVLGYSILPEALTAHCYDELLPKLEQILTDGSWFELDKRRLIFFFRIRSRIDFNSFFAPFSAICQQFGFYLGVSQRTESYCQIEEAYRNAKEAFNSSIFFPDRHIIAWSDCLAAQKEPSAYPYTLEAVVLEALDTCNKNLCCRLINELMERFFSDCGMRYSVFEMWTRQFLQAVAHHIEKKGRLTVKPPTFINTKILPSKITDEIIGWIENIIEESQKYISHPIVFKVIKKIHEDYNKNLTLKSIADSLYVNHIYLSRLFTAETGVSFKEYLISVRMEKAKALLSDETKSIAEVANLTGYSTPNYFSDAFKSFTGYSPKEFRRK